MPEPHIAQLIDRFVRRVHAGLTSKAPAFDPDRIGPGGGMVLLTLAEIEPAPMHELARRMARDKSQMTRTVKALADKGMIARNPCAEDGRVCMIHLTPKGHEMVETLQGVLAETIDQILTPLSDADRHQLGDLLGRAMGTGGCDAHGRDHTANAQG